MDATGNSKYYRPTANLLVACLASVIVFGVLGPDMTPVAAQVRSKRPDRGTYTPPRLESVDVEHLGEPRRAKAIQPVQHEDVMIVRQNDA